MVTDSHRATPHILTLRGNRWVSFLLLLLVLLLLQARGSNEQFGFTEAALAKIRQSTSDKISAREEHTKILVPSPETNFPPTKVTQTDPEDPVPVVAKTIHDEITALAAPC